jgi:Mg2+/Co2+ transporter CorC
VFSPDASATPAAPQWEHRDMGTNGTLPGPSRGWVTPLQTPVAEDPAMFFSPATVDERVSQSPPDVSQLTVKSNKLRQYLFGKRNRGADGRGFPTPGSSRTRDRLASTDNDKEKDGHKGNDRNSDGEPRPLTRDEMTMLGGAFDFAHKNVIEVMTPLDAVFMLDASLLLSFEVMLLIFQSGHSRIPVYEGSRENIVGVLFTKDLILLDPEDAVPIRTVLLFFNRRLLLVHATTPLDEMLNIFKSGGGHLALVQKVKNSGSPHQVSETLGLVTLEDLIEELIGQDIVDETDVFTDNISRKRVRRARSIDPDILKMFDGTKTEEPHQLTDKEVKVVAAYLSNNFEAFDPSQIRPQVLLEMLPEARTVEYPEVSDSDPGPPVISPGGDDPASSAKTRTVGDSDTGLHPEIRESALQSSPTQGVPDDPSERTDAIPASPAVRGAVVTPTHSFVTSLLQYTDSKDAGRKDTESSGPSDTVIYKRGVPTYAAYLVINGKLEITAGDDGFVSEIGPWTLLGSKALTGDLYAPDFTARVSERPARLLQIRRRLYRRMVRYSHGGLELTTEEQSARDSGSMEESVKASSSNHALGAILAPTARVTRVASRGGDIEWSELETDLVRTGVNIPTEGANNGGARIGDLKEETGVDLGNPDLSKYNGHS